MQPGDKQERLQGCTPEQTTATCRAIPYICIKKTGYCLIFYSQRWSRWWACSEHGEFWGLHSGGYGLFHCAPFPTLHYEYLLTSSLLNSRCYACSETLCQLQITFPLHCLTQYCSPWDFTFITEKGNIVDWMNTYWEKPNSRVKNFLKMMPLIIFWNFL